MGSVVSAKVKKRAKAKKTTKKPGARRRSPRVRRLTINVRSASKDATKCNISAEVYDELRAYIEDVFIPCSVKLSERMAKREGKKTIQERDYIRARDFINARLAEVYEYG